MLRGEFSAKVVAHLVPVAEGGAGSWSRSPPPPSRSHVKGPYSRRLEEVFAELCKNLRPARRDEHVRAACWIQRTTPDTCVPSGGTPFNILFSCDARTNQDALTQALDGDTFRTGFDYFWEGHFLLRRTLASARGGECYRAEEKLQRDRASKGIIRCETPVLISVTRRIKLMGRSQAFISPPGRFL